MKSAKLIVISMIVVLSVVAVVMASQVTAVKSTDPVLPNKYHVGDTIHYVMTITNPVANPATNILSDVHDHTPSGIDVFFIQAPPDDPLVQFPGDTNMFTLDYIVLEADMDFLPAVPPIPGVFDGVPAQMAVINEFHGSGVDTLQDLVNVEVQRNSQILNPCIDVNKTVDPLVAIEGDEVTYTFTICNCGDANLTLTEVNDNVLGDLLSFVPADGLVLDAGLYNAQGVLQLGECTTFQVPYTIQPGDPDPLCNEVCVTGVDELGGPEGTVEDCDPACVDLVVPDIDIEKRCDEFSKVGDVITYNVCITNTGETSLEILSVEDDVADANQTCVGDILAPDAFCCFSYPYTVQAGDPDPIINEVSVIAKVVGVDVNVTDSTSCETDLVDPNFTVTKECLTEPVEGDMAQFRITIENTGDVNLIINTNEPEIPADQLLAVGQTLTVDVNRAVVPGESEVSNTIEVTATLPAVYELPNVIEKSASASCTVPGDEGCTPGFWKNSPACWCEDFNTTDTLGSVFTIPCGAVYGTGSNCLANKTLMQALSFQGGSTTKAKAQILLRAAVAALLNACNDDVEFPLTEEAIIDAVNDAIASMNKTEIITLAGVLDYYNNFGCPISSANSSNPCTRHED